MVPVYESFLVNVRVGVQAVAVAVPVLVLEVRVVVRRVGMGVRTMTVDVLVHLGLVVEMVAAGGGCRRPAHRVGTPARRLIECDRASGAESDDREVAEARFVADRRADRGARRVEPRGVDDGHRVAAFARYVLHIA